MKILLHFFVFLKFILLFAPGVFAFNDTEQQKTANLIQTLSKAEQLRDSSFDSSIEVGIQAVKLAESIQTSELLAKSYKSLAKTYLYKGTFDSSLYYYNKALNEFIILHDSLNVGKVNSNLGIIYRRQGKYDKALGQYQKALKYYKAIGHKEGVASVHLNIGGVYHKLDNWNNALKYYNSAKEYFENTKNNRKLSRTLTNIGVIKFEQKQFKESLRTQLRALRLNEKVGGLQHKAIILLNIGQSYEALGKLDKAIDYYTQCENLRIKLNDTWGLGKIFSFKAVTYDKLKEDNLAQAYFEKAIKFNKANSIYDDLSDTYLYYTNFLETRGKANDALTFYKKYLRINDSLRNIYQEEKVANLTAQFQSEQNAKELELLQQRTQIQNLELGQKNAWIITLLVILILGIVAVFVSLRINRLRADHKIMDLRQKVLLTQMNPHFLFNSLTAIQSFILDEKNNEANTYLSRLASLVRGILENSREEFVSLRTELSVLEDYISMQKLRFDNDIAYNFNVEENIDIDQVIIPPMLAQPFIENALIHGRLRNNPEAEIKVNISLLKNDLLQFEILDNGIGVDEAKKQMKENNHKSLATSIALDRVKIYNFKSSKKMNFEIIDLKQIDKNLHGTKVTYTIPLQSIDD
jgi:tetratricopeptide (TPR) repeat protein